MEKIAWQGRSKASDPSPLDVSTISAAPAPKPVVQTRTTAKKGYRDKCRAKVLGDDLGTYVQRHARVFSECQNWEQFVEKIKPRGELHVVDDTTKSHPAYHLLKHLETKGAPGLSHSEPWSDATYKYRLRRGSHKSCKEHMPFLREEMLTNVKKGFWFLLPEKMVRKWRDAGRVKSLRVSPMGVVPQRERRPRVIVDYTFHGVNGDTVQLGPQESMQFGRALERVLYQVRHANPRYGPVHLGKVDLADGFCRVPLHFETMLMLAVAFPRYPGEEQLIAFPLVLPMGWIESVPWFCCPTETIADIATNLPRNITLPIHPLEALADTPPPNSSCPTKVLANTPLPSDHPDLTSRTSQWSNARSASMNLPPSAPPGTDTLVAAEPRILVQKPNPPIRILAQTPALRPSHKPVNFFDIYMDDFLLGIQGTREQRLYHTRKLLHAIDQVFRPVDEYDPSIRQHIPSVKKMLKGNAYLSPRKVVLGWLIDTIQGTVELPPHRIERLREIFNYLRGRDRVGLAKWHKFLGELRSMAIGIPGSRGLFSLLQNALKFKQKDRVRITQEMMDQLLDFEYLVNDLSRRPTAISEIVPDLPVAIGPHDASGKGMGGAWLSATTDSNLGPILWRAKFPEEIQQRLVSWENPAGDINNSELELAGAILHQDILLQEVDCTGRTVVPLGDNTPTVSWHHKGSTSTTGPAAYLLRLNSLHQRHYRYLSKADYLSGPGNVMADDCSRLWDLSDSQLVAHFNTHYPQTTSWRIVHPRPEMLSAVISALQSQRVEPQSFLGTRQPKTVIGECGKSLLLRSKAPTPTSRMSQKPGSFLFSKYSPRNYGEDSSRPAVTLSSLARWRTIYVPSARRSPWWGPTTPA